MKQIGVLFGVFVAIGFAATFKQGLRVTFGVSSTPGKDCFYEMPLSKGKAIEMGWTQLERPPSALPSLTMFCPIERNICIMFDPVTECVAGLQVAVALKATTGMPYDWSTQGFVSWTAPATDDNANDYKNITYMTKQVYFVTEESLSVSDEERLKNADECKALQQDAVWITGFNQKLIKVGATSNGTVEAGFTMQNCIPGMGTHYLFKLTKLYKCSAETMMNWFMLLDRENVVGLGFQITGKVSPIKGQRYFFERPTPEGVKWTLKESPDCLIELAKDPTFTTMHMYFIDEPWKIEC